jgi:hypothetical protein
MDILQAGSLELGQDIFRRRPVTRAPRTPLSDFRTEVAPVRTNALTGKRFVKNAWLV